MHSLMILMPNNHTRIYLILIRTLRCFALSRTQCIFDETQPRNEFNTKRQTFISISTSLKLHFAFALSIEALKVAIQLKISTYNDLVPTQRRYSNFSAAADNSINLVSKQTRRQHSENSLSPAVTSAKTEIST